jgi:tRNA(fMet)-specific endonuclease VapC
VGRRLILDTCVLIGIERGKLNPAALFVESDDLAIAEITLTELRVGALMADERRRAARSAALERAAKAFTVIGYPTAVSEKHAELLVWTRRRGSPRGPFDLIVAATALATGRSLVTADRKAAFADLPGVLALEPSDLA